MGDHKAVYIHIKSKTSRGMDNVKSNPICSSLTCIQYWLVISLFISILPFHEAFAFNEHPLFRKLTAHKSFQVAPYPIITVNGKQRKIVSQGFVDFVEDKRTWIPIGKSISHPYSKECSVETLDKELARAGSDTYLWSKAAHRFIKKCDGQLTPGAPSKNGVILALEKLKYQMQINPDIREVEIQLSTGASLHGFMGLKRNPHPRPLIIVKCGLFCDSQPSSHFKLLMMHLFDESPFHVLIIESVTSPSFAKFNQRVGVGGLEEGRQIVEIAQLLAESELGKHVSEIHTISPSLGGQAALYASIYNSYHPLSNGKPALQSSLALCPVVNLENSFNDLFSGIKRDLIFGHLIHTVLTKVFPFIESVRSSFDPRAKFSEEQIENILLTANLDYYKSLSARDLWYPFQQTIQDKWDLWDRNDFIKQSSWLRQTPTIVIAADDDWIVRSTHNSYLIDTSKITGPSSSINTLHLAHGSHCGFSASYGWDYFSTLLRNYVLNHSREFRRQSRWHEDKLEALSVSLKAGERHMQQWWRLLPHSPYAELTFRIWTGQPTSHFSEGSDCRRQGSRLQSGNTCFRQRTIQIPLANIGLSWLQPQNQTQAEAVTRWANSRLKVIDEKGQPLIDSQSYPSYIRWLDYHESPE